MNLIFMDKVFWLRIANFEQYEISGQLDTANDEFPHLAGFIFI